MAAESCHPPHVPLSVREGAKSDRDTWHDENFGTGGLSTVDTPLNQRPVSPEVESHTTKPLVSWYAVQANPKQERRAAANLAAWGIETYVPWFRSGSQRGGPLEPLFPGYVFARFVADEMLRGVQFTRGVRRVVSFGGVCPPIDDSVIDLCRSRITEQGYLRPTAAMAPGEPVVITHGPFKDVAGLFERMLSAPQRAAVLLTALTYQARVIIPLSAIGKTRT